MFPTYEQRPKSLITVHPALRRVAALARAFILLEDPEPPSPHVPLGDPVHPHRAPLRPRLGTVGGGLPTGMSLEDQQRWSSDHAAPEPARQGARPGAATPDPVR